MTTEQLQTMTNHELIVRLSELVETMLEDIAALSAKLDKTAAD